MPDRSYREYNELRGLFREHLADQFCVKAAAYMQHYKWKPLDFEERTCLSADTYSKISNGKARPGKRTVVALCVGLALDYRMAVDLLSSAGYTFTLNDAVDDAYTNPALKEL